MKNRIKELRVFIFLWSTQSLSHLGSAMTNFALGIWLYEKTGSALQAALLNICSYTPYVVMSIFAGALSDQWDKKKVMLVCDLIAALCTVSIFTLLKMDMLMPWHMYVLNAINGLMNTIQQPASEVAITLVTPKDQFQRASGMKSFSNSLITIMHPILATSLFAIGGMDLVIFLDLLTFVFAFVTLAFWIRIPNLTVENEEQKDSLLKSASVGLAYLRETPLIFMLILFMAGVNLMTSAFDAVLPAYVLSCENGGKTILGLVTSCAGIATLTGSVVVTMMPAPKNRIRTIYLTMLISLSVENFLLAFSREPVTWCIGQFIGWVLVPLMSANLDVINRSTIPAHLQGRVYACRNTLQFFTIPIGLFIGGFLNDNICEPFMDSELSDGIWRMMFGFGSGSGAAMVLCILGIAGTIYCLIFGKVLQKYEFKD